MKKIIINNLCIEVTRRCNLSCNHCMRGNSQNINLNNYELNQLFFNDKFSIKQIKSLVITGGEPTLNVKSIALIVKGILDNKIKLDSFTMVINGTNYNQDLMDSLNILYNYWLNSKGNEFSLICSLDQFHKEPKREVLEKYSKYPFFISNRIVLDNTQITRIGRAYINKLGTIGSYQLNQLYFDLYKNNNLVSIYKDENNDIYLDKLYLSSKGKYGYYIMDATYDMIDELCTFSLEDLVNALNQETIHQRKKKHF